MARLNNLTIKPRRIPEHLPQPQHEVKHMVADYIITSCELCETEIAMTVPFDGEPVRCAVHDQRSSDRYQFSEAVIAFDDDLDDEPEDSDLVSSQYEYLDENGEWQPYEGSIDCE